MPKINALITITKYMLAMAALLTPLSFLVNGVKALKWGFEEDGWVNLIVGVFVLPLAVLVAWFCIS